MSIEKSMSNDFTSTISAELPGQNAILSKILLNIY